MKRSEGNSLEPVLSYHVAGRLGSKWLLIWAISPAPNLNIFLSPQSVPEEPDYELYSEGGSLMGHSLPEGITKVLNHDWYKATLLRLASIGMVCCPRAPFCNNVDMLPSLSKGIHLQTWTWQPDQEQSNSIFPRHPH